MASRIVFAIAVITMASACSGPFGPSRERAIAAAKDQVNETMRIALPDVPHPEPYEYEDAGDCALVPGLNSSKETLRYQVKITLAPGDDGQARQATAVQHWVGKGAQVRDLPYRSGPPAEVNYQGGSIMAFAMQQRGRSNEAVGTVEFWIVATTPCIPKAD